jgi:hypothetical protein
MALVQLRLDPSPRDLKWFGLILLLSFAALAGMAYLQFGSSRAASILLGVGGGLSLLYTAVPPLRRIMYVSWMRLVYPVGWVVSQVILVFTFYLVLTPTGWLVRLFGADEIAKKPDPDADSYWLDVEPVDPVSSYFRQS